MSYSFERPVGAAADAKELEYIAALHQTKDDDDDGWIDASIEATDVKNYLLSRYGVEVTKKEVLEGIFADLGGGDNEDECIDLTEVVAILLIPFLAKIGTASEDDVNTSERESFEVSNFQSQFEREAYLKAAELKKMNGENKTILSNVLKMILHDTTGSATDSIVLTRELMQQIFEHYGEDDLLKDDAFIDEMIEAASGGDSGEPELNSESFLRALTHDTKLYDVLNESKFQTHYEDVFGLLSYTKEHSQNRGGLVPDDESRSSQQSAQESDIKRQFTFPQIDSLSDTFRSRTQYMVAWVAVVFGYISWFEIGFKFGIQVCKEENMDQFGCQVTQSIALWFALMASMILIVAPCVMILNLGNNVYRHSIVEILCGIIGTLLIVILPPLWEFEWLIISTKTLEGAESISLMFDVVCIVLGCILLCLQLANVIRFVVPDSRLTDSKALTTLLRGSAVRSEFGIKQASVFKVHQLVRNAYQLHGRKMKRSTVNSGLRPTESIDLQQGDNKDALLNFTKVTENRETSGGFLWAWKTFLSGDLIEREGLWIHTKLLAGNIAQVVLTFGLAIFAFVILYPTIDFIYNDIETATNEAESASLSCITVFDPEKCYFPEINGTSTGIAVCSDIFFLDPACADRLVEAEGDTYDLFCTLFEEGVNQLPFPGSSLYDDCPSLYVPFPQGVTSVTPDSTDESYCIAPLSACTSPSYYDDTISMEVCVIGFGTSFTNPTPFQFNGDLCSSYTEMDQLLADKAEYGVSDYSPKKWMFQTCVIVGCLGILLVGIAVSISTIPSIIVTTLRFRSGSFESLRDPYFKKYRKGLLATAFLLGGTIWGAVISSFVVFMIAFIGTFLVVYQVTRPYILLFLSTLIGISVTLLFKILLSFFLNRYNFAGFYRKRPLIQNISSLCFECWHLGLTLSYIILRCVKLFGIMIVYVGRFDTPVLAKGVGEIGPIKLDAFPFIFKQDLLAMDAHRHPYIERLGMMYLMKLKHGKNFASKTGSTWRLLFVFALFPWLRKYRVLDDGEDQQSDGSSKKRNRVSVFKTKIAALNEKIRLLTDDNKNLKEKRLIDDSNNLVV